jgi:hypothetical protein
VTKTLKVDSRGRVRFTQAGFRFEVTSDDPTVITVYDRFEGETKLGTIDLMSVARALWTKTPATDAVQSVEAIGVGGYY